MNLGKVKINGKIILSFLVIAVFAALTWDLRPIPIDGRVDDWKYVRDGLSIANLKWLGAYNELTLIKRPFFSIVIAVTKRLNLPWTLFLFSFCLFSINFLRISLRKLGLSAKFSFLILLALLFLPTFYDRESIRMTRDMFFICWQLLLLGLAFRLMALPLDWSSKDFRKLSIYFFLALAFHVGLREEAAVFWPCLVILLLFYVKQQKFPFTQKVVHAAFLLFLGVVSIQMALLSIRAANYFAYGVFILNEHEEGTFPKAMAAIASIKRSDQSSRLLIDYEHRQQLKKISPSFAQISEILDSEGETATPQCRALKTCEANDYSHAIFFLRSHGLPAAGVTDSALKAEQFYEKLRIEISQACENNKISCETPLRTSMRPPFKNEYLPYLKDALKIHLGYHFTLANRGFAHHSHRDVDQRVIDDFARATKQHHYRIFPDGGIAGALPASLQVLERQKELRSFMGTFYSSLGPYIVGLGIFCCLIRLFAALWIGLDVQIVIACALLSTIVSRLAAIVYISAVDNLMARNYVVPNYSLLLLFSLLAISSLTKIFTKDSLKDL